MDFLAIDVVVVVMKSKDYVRVVFDEVVEMM